MSYEQRTDELTMELHAPKEVHNDTMFDRPITVYEFVAIAALGAAAWQIALALLKVLWESITEER